MNINNINIKDTIIINKIILICNIINKLLDTKLNKY